MITNMSLEEMKLHQSPAYYCAVCGGELIVAWGGAFGYNGYVLRCANDVIHEGLARSFHLGAYDTPDILFNLKRKRREKLEKELGTEKATALMPYHGSGQLSKLDATLILKTCWPDAPAVEVEKAAIICWQYGLNPLMKHLFLVGFTSKKTGKKEWSTIVALKATRLMAHRKGTYSYLDDTPRVMTDEEQIKTFGEVDKANLWAITVLRDKHQNNARGYGFWPKSENPYGADKGNSKFNMAATRSERQALDRLFPDTLPAGIEVADEAYVDMDTGEIIDAEPAKETEEQVPGPSGPVAIVIEAKEQDNGPISVSEKPMDHEETATLGPVKPPAADKFRTQIEGMLTYRFKGNKVKELAFLEQFGVKKLDDITDLFLPKVYEDLANLGKPEEPQGKLEV